jgi:hypothetical protein
MKLSKIVSSVDESNLNQVWIVPMFVSANLAMQTKSPISIMTQPLLTFLRSALSITEQRKLTMVLLRFSNKEFLFLGLELAGFPAYTIGRNKKKMNRERFKDSFYARPHQTVENIFDDIQDEDLGESRISKPDPIYLLLALFYLKKYPTKQGRFRGMLRHCSV